MDFVILNYLNSLYFGLEWDLNYDTKSSSAIFYSYHSENNGDIYSVVKLEAIVSQRMEVRTVNKPFISSSITLLSE